MVEITVSSLAELDSVIETSPYVIADFGKDDCPGCNAMDRTLEQLKHVPEYSDVTLVKAKLETVGRQAFVDLRLRSAPSILLFKNGDEQYRFAGAQQTSTLMNAINTHLFEREVV
jgi:thioredoxin 1